MAESLNYPEVTPPSTWSFEQVGSQIHLYPKGNATVRIVLSPLLSRGASGGVQDRLPAPERLIELALEAETTPAGIAVSLAEPTQVTTPSGLLGVRREATLPGQRRLYDIYTDAICYYGLTYLADEAMFATYLQDYLALAASLLPFSGTVLTPPGTPVGSPMENYTD